MAKKHNIIDTHMAKRNPFFEGIREGMLEVVDSLEKGKPLTCREVSLPEPPPEMKAREIVDLRKNELNLSQHVFAVLLNVSLKTVQAWEQAINTPSGPSLRLLWLAKRRPDLFKSLITHHAV
jgi:putative transcriptional regulator